MILLVYIYPSGNTLMFIVQMEYYSTIEMTS